MELTNREIYFDTKKEIENRKLNISDNEIYLLLEKANDYKNFTELSVNFDKNIANLEYFLRLKEQLFNGEPIQYILNNAPFLSFDFYVDKRVLIPRVETEELVKRTISIIKKFNLNKDKVFDVCTGSGCIAISLKNEFPTSEVFASDISIDAINVAKINAEKYHTKINFLEGDKTNPFIESKLKADVIISNPPYVENKIDIEEKVKKYEPLNAIYSKDGTAFYEDVFKHYKEITNSKFFMAFEINYDQEEKLTNLIKIFFDENIIYKFVKDIYGLTRFLFIIGGYDDENFN